MKPTLFMPLALLSLTGCGPDETVSGFADPNATYVLATIDDIAFAANATISFTAEGSVSGSGPCNTFNATQSVPYPWFELGPIASTRRACPDLALESDYFAALATMRFAEVLGDTLILTGEDGGPLMVFQAE